MSSRRAIGLPIAACVALAAAVGLALPGGPLRAQQVERLMLPLLVRGATWPPPTPSLTLVPGPGRTPAATPAAATATAPPTPTTPPPPTGAPSPTATATSTRTPTPPATPTTEPTATALPAPDGRIAYVEYNIFQTLTVVGADGTNPLYPVDLENSYDRPVWSPSGTRIAYNGGTAFFGEGFCHTGAICVMDVDARAQWRLTPEGMRGARPAWSPGGAMVAFMVAAEGGWDIAVAAADGAWMRTVVASTGADMHPTWSPDGRRLAYISDRDGPDGRYGDMDLYVVDLDSGEDRLLLDLDAEIDAPRWSPGGEWIAFTASVDGAGEIMLVRAGGQDVHNLTEHGADDRSPAWSPDGARIAFVSDRDGQDEVYIMRADGAQPENVSDSPDPDADPVWSPDGHWLAYVAYIQGHTAAAREPRVRLVRADGTGGHELAEGANPHWGATPDPDAPPAPGDPAPPAPASGPAPAPVPTADAAGWLAYSVPGEDGQVRVYVEDLSSADARLLATLEGREVVLAFDGACAALVTVPEYPGLWEMHLAGLDGAEPALLMRGEHPDVRVHRVDWSPDGDGLAVSEGLLDYQQAVHVLDPATPPDILAEVRVTPQWEFYSDAAWWPDGERLVLAFAAYGPTIWDRNIVTMLPDGEGQTLLLARATDESWPVPSPDGSRIAFVSDASGDDDVYVMDADGRHVVNLTHHPEADRYPVWSPDGEMIAFRSTRAGDQGIYVLHADGSRLRRLSLEEAGSGSFAWVVAAAPILPAPGLTD